ncbi:MAG TPA: PDZ domain-containing protein [Thermoanaerobaculia bacterium]
MKTSVLNATLWTVLLLAPPASLLRASDPPDPPEPAIAPIPPAPPEAPRARVRKVVVASPEEEILVDGDRVVIRGDADDRDRMADLDEIYGDDGQPLVLHRHGRPSGGFIGVHPLEMTPELRQHFGAPKDAGVLVGSVEPEGPAAKAGFQVGDIVTKVDGESIGSAGELVRTVRRRKGGETITVQVFRNRAAKSLTLTVVERQEKEIRVGELHEKFPRHAWSWSTPGPERHTMAAPPPPDFPEFEQRLDDLEKKMKELEGRLPGR